MIDLRYYEAFIFDLDGTLIDSEKYHAEAFAEAVFDQSGYRVSEDEKNEFFGSHSVLFSSVLNKRHGLKLEPKRVLKQKRKRVREIFKADLFDGALEFLQFWHGKKPMVLATNSPFNFVEPALAAADLLKYFDPIITADDVKHRKPNPEIVQLAVNRLGFSAESIMMFEDQIIGIEAAKQAGVSVCVVDNGQRITYPDEIPMVSWKELLH